MAESLEIVLLIVCALGCLYLAKMLFSSAANDDDAARLSRHNSGIDIVHCLLYTSPSPRDQRGSRMPSSA